jgi:signal transduction histidine kinase
MWALVALGCVLLTSAVLLRRRPLTAMAITLGGSVVVQAVQPLRTSTVLMVVAGAAGIEICYITATRARKVSVTSLVMAGAGLLALPLGPSPAPASAVHPSAVHPNAVHPSAVSSSAAGVHLTSFGGGFAASVLPAAVLVAVIAWLIGNSIRQAHAQAELVRAQAAAQTVMAERLRIARELHDIVAHSIGVIAIQAGAGRRIFDARPAEARDALAAIEVASRETLSGLRRMVTGLRHAEPESGQAQLGPAPGLADVERLAAITLDAGVRVEVDWRGSREPLPADIDLSAFRIIQEAVTNVVRHAGTGQCQVLIDQQDEQLTIEVTDTGRGTPASKTSLTGTGYGITGMRERAVLLGGEFSAGPRLGGGFGVTARLPLPAPVR